MTRPAKPAATGRPEAALVFRSLAALRSACVLYPKGHPAIESQVADVHRHMTAVLGDRPVARLDVIRGVLNCDGQPLAQESRVHARILEEFAALGVDSIHLAAGVSPDEIAAVGQFLAHEHRGAGAGRPVVNVLGESGVSHISFGRIIPVNDELRDRVWPEAPEVIHDGEYERSADLARRTFESLEQGFDPDVEAIHDILDILVGRVARSGIALSQVMALKEYENGSYLHSVNVALLAVRLGERLGLDESELRPLAEAALLHDVGKTRIPVEILTKTGRPTEREWRVIRRHPLVGAEILSTLDGLGPLTPLVALEHHVGFDGEGYPALGRGRLPHSMSQIISVVDVYESVTGARTYRKPTTPDRACLILARMAGEKLNPALVKAFVSVVTFFPLGSIVRTTRDEIGVVIATHEDDALHPLVVLVDPERPDAPPGRRIDLRERDDRGRFVRDVVEILPADRARVDVPGILRSL